MGGKGRGGGEGGIMWVREGYNMFKKMGGGYNVGYGGVGMFKKNGEGGMMWGGGIMWVRGGYNMFKKNWGRGLVRGRYNMFKNNWGWRGRGYNMFKKIGGSERGVKMWVRGGYYVECEGGYNMMFKKKWGGVG
ncbi:hypothetical protein DPMN_126727 [Dreissena polymorpha]|uniref:Uncharacterized protein n=1 Tax=Dreissena polymorpha TaxID=45954 RepID=A0A9D4GXN0_DREPO|nr:hypothetical protein DPMN_126727 [Dreissena polymorpha]